MKKRKSQAIIQVKRNHCNPVDIDFSMKEREGEIQGEKYRGNREGARRKEKYTHKYKYIPYIELIIFNIINDKGRRSNDFAKGKRS